MVEFFPICALYNIFKHNDNIVKQLLHVLSKGGRYESHQAEAAPARRRRAMMEQYVIIISYDMSSTLNLLYDLIVKTETLRMSY